MVSTTSNQLGTWLTRYSESDKANKALHVSSPTGEAPSYAQNSVGEAVFVGYLFNLNDLRQILNTPLLSEAGLLLAAYERWGEQFVEKLNGIYSFGLWDRRKDILICARDRLGHFPLFYAQTSTEFFFSTTTQGLLSHPNVSSQLNRLSLAVHLSHRWTDNTQTFYQAISRLPAGHFLSYSKGNLSITRYWNPIPQNGKIDWLGEEAFEDFAHLFESTIRNYLSLGRPGMFLSGGLDSVSVAAVATDECKLLKREPPLLYLWVLRPKVSMKA